jgi:hypothetical protein
MNCFHIKKLFKSGDPPANSYAIQHQIKEQLLLETLHSNSGCTTNTILTALYKTWFCDPLSDTSCRRTEFNKHFLYRYTKNRNLFTVLWICIAWSVYASSSYKLSVCFIKSFLNLFSIKVCVLVFLFTYLSCSIFCLQLMHVCIYCIFCPPFSSRCVISLFYACFTVCLTTWNTCVKIYFVTKHCSADTCLMFGVLTHSCLFTEALWSWHFS